MADTSSDERNSRKRRANQKDNNGQNNGGFSIKKPDRWLQYDPVGRDIPGTRMIAFKTPLSPQYFTGLPADHEERFEVETLLKYAKQAGKTMGLVVNLCFTDRYYDASLWTNNGVKYEHIRCPGHEVHGERQEHLVRHFMNVVRKFFAENADNDKIVGVHCTHGVNRTGYMICHYLITDRGWAADRAIEAFGHCRRHKIERQKYTDALRELEMGLGRNNFAPGASGSKSATSTSSAASVRVPQEAPKPPVAAEAAKIQPELVERLKPVVPEGSGETAVSTVSNDSPQSANLPVTEDREPATATEVLRDNIPEPEGISVKA